MNTNACACHLGTPPGALLQNSKPLKNFGISARIAGNDKNSNAAHIDGLVLSASEIPAAVVAIYADTENCTLWLVTADASISPFYIQLDKHNFGLDHLSVLQWIGCNAAEGTCVNVLQVNE